MQLKERRINLKRLLKKQLSGLLEVLSDEPFFIEDEAGQIIFQKEGNITTVKKHEIQIEGLTIGWVTGGAKADAMADLLSYLANQDIEKKALGRDTLEKYKEITVLYDIAEKLAASLDPKQAAQLVIEEVRRLIYADNISLVLMDRESDIGHILASIGQEYSPKVTFRPGLGITGAVLLTGKGEIINEVDLEPRFIKGINAISSLMCAPMTIKEKIIGVINVSTVQPCHYTAGDLKILSALALQAAAAIENARLYDSLKETFLTAVYTLAETIEKRDPYTGGHTKRVMGYSVALGQQMGLAEEELEQLRLAAILHDVGKIGVRDNVLLKNGKLTNEEFEEIKKHTVYGEEVLRHIRYFKDIIPGVLQHHERYDGRGYPAGIKGEEIHPTARIIAVADTYDAMTTDRPYRKGLSHEFAVDELKRCAGSQFDQRVVEAFLSLDIQQVEETL